MTGALVDDPLARAAAFCAETPGLDWLVPLLQSLPPWIGAGLDNSLPLILFLTGLAGSATHCVGMCGPFVATQVIARLDRVAVADAGGFTRLRGAALLPYHAGRATSYALLGGVTASLAAGGARLPGLRWVVAALLILAALAILAQALGRLSRFHLPGIDHLGRWVAKHARPFLEDSRGGRGYVLGVALGFLPCGLVYGAIAAAGSAGGFGGGVVAMLAFSAGTVPVLFAVGLFGAWFGRRWLPLARKLAVPLLLFNALILLVMAALELAGGA